MRIRNKPHTFTAFLAMPDEKQPTEEIDVRTRTASEAEARRLAGAVMARDYHPDLRILFMEYRVGWFM